MDPKDPYKYFRIEARELLESLNQDTLALDKAEGPDQNLINRLLRQAHTLKGASRVVKLTAIADLAHSFEEALSPYRDGKIRPGSEIVTSLLKHLDGVGAHVALLDRPLETPASPETQAPDNRSRYSTVRLEMGELDKVVNGLSEMAVQVTAIRQEFTSLERARQLAEKIKERGPATDELKEWLENFQNRIGTCLDHTEREMSQAHQNAGRLRLLPARALFEYSERAVRDAAQALGKNVRFEARGARHRLDAPVLAALEGALLHIVRNAVAHGIESEAERLSRGKPAEGTIELVMERHGSLVSVQCRDDGRGIDAAAVRRAAIQKGLLAPSAPDPLSLEDAAQILLKGGLSTTRAVTEISGRGVGLDVAREAVERLNGTIALRSEPGAGTTVEIRVPFTLSSFTALTVELDGMTALIPFDSVRRVVKISDAEMVLTSDRRSIIFDQETVPFLGLEEVLSPAASPRQARRNYMAVMVQSGSALAAIGIDRLLEVREIVVRPMPELVPHNPVWAGACLDAEGNPCLVLDPQGLTEAARGAKSIVAATEPVARPPLLIIDDSLTTRMLEQSILESAGYELDLAVSAEEGLEKARQKRYGLILVDVEMPGMDGFEFLKKKQEEVSLREIPAILVTSRGSLEDRRRGQAAGARDYIVKGEFDQNHLLRTIRGLLG